MIGPNWRFVLDVVSAEGLSGAIARVADRARESARRMRFQRSTLGRLAPLGPLPVLNVLPFPLAARFGGVANQLADRLEAERRDRPVALLSFGLRFWRLEVESSGHRLVAEGALNRSLENEEEPREAIRVIEQAATTIGARIVHFENLVGLPLTGVADLARRIDTIVSNHDFALFCPRPHLLEEPDGHFCGFSRDIDRCRRCLDSGPCPIPHAIDRHRIAAARLVERARLLVHPSNYMLRALAELFPGKRQAEAVIPPAISITRPRSRRLPRRPPRRVAFFGQASQRKGVTDFAAAAATLSRTATGVDWLVLGGGKPRQLDELARSGLRVLGSYRVGKGACALNRHRADLAVLPSRFPEAHCLALDECIAAGVPVVASDRGALGERVRELSAGLTFGTEPGALERTLAEALRQPPSSPPRLASESTPERAASAHLELYAELDRER